MHLQISAFHRRVLLFLLLSFCTPALSRAQGPDEYERVFALGLEALSNRRFDEGIAAFRRCLELRPETADCAYNLACAYALKGDARTALDWLSRAIDWGYDDLEHLRADADLESLRQDVRYRALVARLEGEPAAAPDAESTLNRASHLVAMVDGRLEGEQIFGAGIVFGRRGDSIYIATARHVVRHASAGATDITVRLRSSPAQPIPARLTPHSDAQLDVAVIAARMPDSAFNYCDAFPLDRLGDRADLARGAPVYPVGFPNGAPWGMPVAPDHIAQLVGDDVTFQSAFINVGHSGGGLLSDDGKLVAMIRADTPPYGVAVDMTRVLAVLRGWGYPVHLRTGRGFVRTPLHEAVEEGDVELVRQLVATCADINTHSDAGVTPLHLAVRRGAVDMAKLLLEAGADAALPTRERQDADLPHELTPLHFAATQGSQQMVELLLAHGADVAANARDYLSKWGGTPLHFAARSGATATIDVLLRKGADIDAGSRDGSPITWAVAARQLDAIRLLIARGASLERSVVSPLSVAADSGAADATKLLLEAHADPNEVRGLGAPLHRAAERGFLGVVKLLLAAGADPDLRAHEATALHKAAAKGHLEVVRALLDAGATPDARNYDGSTPLDLARQAQHSEVVALLSARQRP